MKKWTYLVAACLLAGATPVLTGCIDNDEPAGIEQLRGAKAELIIAKKAVVEAEAKRVEAEAAYWNAQADLVKAQEAIQTAIAEKIKAEAEQIAALTEAQKAQYEAQIKLIQAQIATEQQKAAAALQAMQNAMQAAEIAHQQALQELINAQIEAVTQGYGDLTYWKDRYDQAYKAYLSAEDWLIAKEQALTEAKANVSKVTNIRPLERKVKEYTTALENAQEVLDNYNEQIKEWQDPNMTPSELVTKKEELEKQIYDVKMAKEEVVIAKEEAKLNNEEYAKQTELTTAYTDAKEEEIAIEEFVNTIDDEQVPYWSYDKDEVIVAEGAFTVDEYGTVTGDYSLAEANLKAARTRASQYILDEDDEVWTEATVNEYTTLLTQQQKALTDKENGIFAEVVEAYNMGKGTLTSAYTGYEALKTAIDAYTTAGAALDVVKADINAKQKTMDAALKAWEEATNKTVPDEYDADKIRDAEIGLADEALNTALGEAQEAYENSIAAAEEAYIQAENDVRIKVQEMNLAYANWQANITSTALETIYNNSVTAWRNSLTTYEQKRIDFENAEALADEERQQAQSIAIATYQLAYEKAEINYANNVREWESTIDPEYTESINALKEDYDTAKEAYDEAYKGLKPAQEAVKEALNKANEAYGKMAATDYDNYDWNGAVGTATQYIAMLDKTTYKLDITKLDIDSKKYLIEISKELYGFLAADEIADEVVGLPGAQITKLDKEGVDKILAKEYPDMPKSQYVDFYNQFGMLGECLVTQASIDKAKAYVTNTETFTKFIEDIKARLEKLEADKDAQQAVVEAAKEAKEAQDEVIEELEAEFDEQIAAYNTELKTLQGIQAAIENTLNNVAEGDDKLTQADIDYAISYLQGLVETQELAVFDAETNLKAAEEALQAAQNGESAEVLEAQIARDAAERALKRAETDLEVAEQELQDYIAKIEAASQLPSAGE